MSGSLLSQARTGTPVISDGLAMFVWEGTEPPQLIGDFTGWEWGTPLSLTEAGTGVWTHSLELPSDAYIEYAYWRDGERVADPLSPHTVPDGIGHANHFFWMPAASPTSLTRRERNALRGTVTLHTLNDDFLLAGRKRTVLLYQPPVSEPSPLLVVLDGQDYRPRGRLVQIADNLIDQGRIRPLALAMIYHAGQARGVEYACSEVHLSALLHLLLPLAQRQLKLLDPAKHPGAYGIMGASMGGLMALFAGLRRPQVFGGVLSQSGAFVLGDEDTVVWDLVRQGPVRPLKIGMDVGRFECLLQANRRMSALLAERGYDVTYREFSGGHNYTAWRNDLLRGLEALYGPS